MKRELYIFFHVWKVTRCRMGWENENLIDTPFWLGAQINFFSIYWFLLLLTSVLGYVCICTFIRKLLLSAWSTSRTNNRLTREPADQLLSMWCNSFSYAFTFRYEPVLMCHYHKVDTLKNRVSKHKMSILWQQRHERNVRNLKTKSLVTERSKWKLWRIYIQNNFMEEKEKRESEGRYF